MSNYPYETFVYIISRRSHITSELRHSRSCCSQLVMGWGEGVAAGDGEIGGAISAITVR